MFTIEVKKKEKNEEFIFEDVCEGITVFHNECLGGKVILTKKPRKWTLVCQRCGGRTWMKSPFKDNYRKVRMIQTVIDGKERELGGLGEENIHVAQKN